MFGQPGCTGDYSESEECNQAACVGWSKWGSFGACSVTCGAGEQSRTRFCPTNDCPGSGVNSRACNIQECPYWSNWSSFGPCSASCGDGSRSRNRVCIGGEPGDVGCQGPTEFAEACNSLVG